MRRSKGVSFKSLNGDSCCSRITSSSLQIAAKPRIEGPHQVDLMK